MWTTDCIQSNLMCPIDRCRCLSAIQWKPRTVQYPVFPGAQYRSHLQSMTLDLSAHSHQSSAINRQISIWHDDLTRWKSQQTQHGRRFPKLTMNTSFTVCIPKSALPSISKLWISASTHFYCQWSIHRNQYISAAGLKPLICRITCIPMSVTQCVSNVEITCIPNTGVTCIPKIGFYDTRNEL